MAAQIISRVRDTFQAEVPLRTLLEAPTVADMAVIIAQSQATRAAGEDVQRLLAEVEALTDEQARQLFVAEAHTRNIGGPHGR